MYFQEQQQPRRNIPKPFILDPMFKPEFKKKMVEPQSLELLTQIELIKKFHERTEDYDPDYDCNEIHKDFLMYSSNIILQSNDLIRFLNTCKNIDFWIAFNFGNFWKVYHRFEINERIPKENYFILNENFETKDFYYAWTADLVSSTGVKLSPKLPANIVVGIYEQFFRLIEKHFKHMLPEYKEIISSIIDYHNLYLQD